MGKVKEELLSKGLTLEQYKEILKTISNKKEGISDLDWSDILEKYSLELNKDSLRKMNDGIFGGYFVKRYFEEEVLPLTDKSNLDVKFMLELQEKKKELEKLKVQFQDQRREYAKYMRADARWEHLIDEMKASIAELEPMTFEPKEYGNGDKEASLIISDWHFGLECDNLWNTYNKEVARQRVEKLKQKTISYCKLHNIKVLHIEILGDMINGAIHLTTRVESEEDVMSQAMSCSELIANFIRDIAQEIEIVNVYTVNGNHGRVNANKSESIETENFERLIPWYLETRMENIDNVNIIENKLDDTISYYKIGDRNIFSAHGHLDSVKDVVNDYSRMFKIIADEVHLGHFHSYFEKDEHDSTVLVNGSLSGVDTYAKNSRLSGTPTQILRIYGEDICTYKITL